LRQKNNGKIFTEENSEKIDMHITTDNLSVSSRKKDRKQHHPTLDNTWDTIKSQHFY
jgi:hypothetical protein